MKHAANTCSDPVLSRRFRRTRGYRYDRGTTEALIATVAGQVQMMIAGIPPAIGHVRSNRLRALAVSALKRAPALPELPTIDEAGVAGYEYITWYGMLAPAATPKTVVAKLNQSATSVLGTPDLRSKFAQEGLEADSSSPEQFAARVKQEIARWAKIIKAAGIQAE